MIKSVALVAFAAVIFACGHPQQRRTDWRNPPRTCGSDDECNGGKCAIEIGATQGTCSGGGTLPPLPPGKVQDGGARPPGPGPSIQPSSSDIHI